MKDKKFHSRPSRTSTRLIKVLSRSKILPITFTIIFFVFGGIIPATEFFSVKTPAPVLYWNGKVFRPLGFNYYPRDHPWTGLWTDFNATEVREDLLKIKELGGNCVRTFVHWKLIEDEFGVWNWTTVERVENFFEIAEDVNISIQLSFFDLGIPEITSWSPYTWSNTSLYDDGWQGLYRDDFESEEQYQEALNDAKFTNESIINHEIAQLQFLIPRLKNYSSAFIWDIMNEPHSKNVPLETFATWVGRLTAAIKQVDTEHLVVVGGGWENFEVPSIYKDLDVDAVCVHFYRARGSPTWKRQFDYYIQDFIDTGKPVILQEFGWPSYDDIGITEEIQGEYYRAIFDECDKHGVAGIMAWCLWDYTVDLDWKHEGDHSEEHFGVLRTDGSWKPSAQAFHDYATGEHERTW
ncbi:MAG: glycoside hydrolase 5 family protein, partial [Promethearchaeota archaeon]